jgi:hypothetical protein
VQENKESLMVRFPIRPWLLFSAGVALAMQVQAASLGSSASSAASESVGSVSTSLNASSNSSTGAVAQGDYDVVQVAEVAERPGQVQVTLQPRDASAGTVRLELPRQTWARAGIETGGRVHVDQRAYGYEFARADTRAPFYLVLADDWYRELTARPVEL